MIIQSTEPRLLISFQCAEVAPGSRGQQDTTFEIFRIDATLPDAFDAIIILGDMQAVDDGHIPVDARILLGVKVAQELGTYAELGLLPAPERTLICLTGDLFTVMALDKRGGTGDVLPVYRAFANRFPHVCAVAGNHDLFGDGTSIARAEKTGVHVLNGTHIDFDTFRVAGICGIEGNNDKVWRNKEKDLRKLVRTAATAETDLLLVHEPPKTDRFVGSAILTGLLNRTKFVGNTGCGHVRWSSIHDTAKFGHIWNLEGRGVLFADPELEINI